MVFAATCLLLVALKWFSQFKFKPFLLSKSRCRDSRWYDAISSQISFHSHRLVPKHQIKHIEMPFRVNDIRRKRESEKNEERQIEKNDRAKWKQSLGSVWGNNERRNVREWKWPISIWCRCWPLFHAVAATHAHQSNNKSIACTLVASTHERKMISI